MLVGRSWSPAQHKRRAILDPGDWIFSKAFEIPWRIRGNN